MKMKMIMFILRPSPDRSTSQRLPPTHSYNNRSGRSRKRANSTKSTLEAQPISHYPPIQPLPTVTEPFPTSNESYWELYCLQHGTGSYGHLLGANIDVELPTYFPVQVVNMVHQSVFKPPLTNNTHCKHFINSVIFPDTRSPLEYRHVIIGK